MQLGEKVNFCINKLNCRIWNEGNPNVYEKTLASGKNYSIIGHLLPMFVNVIFVNLTSFIYLLATSTRSLGCASIRLQMFVAEWDPIIYSNWYVSIQCKLYCRCYIILWTSWFPRFILYITFCFVTILVQSCCCLSSFVAW